MYAHEYICFFTKYEYFMYFLVYRIFPGFGFFPVLVWFTFWAFASSITGLVLITLIEH